MSCFSKIFLRTSSCTCPLFTLSVKNYDHTASCKLYDKVDCLFKKAARHCLSDLEGGMSFDVSRCLIALVERFYGRILLAIELKLGCRFRATRDRR